MTLNLHKYQGTGNDFILVDNRGHKSVFSPELIKNLCDRHFGIGADGLMLLDTDANVDFKMTYFNSDGNESTMCGNGGRCMVAFAKKLGLIEDKTFFTAIDGLHEAHVLEGQLVSLKMNDVSSVKSFETYFELNTGSPHYVAYVDDVNDIDVVREGRLIRNSPKYKDNGINVNFVEALSSKKIKVYTYERGVEDETLSCGTGVTAAAITCVLHELGTHEIQINSKGGNLKVKLEHVTQGLLTNIWLEGNAEFVFEARIDV
jgi:diaminopimelate epimerase